jgi:UPF0755 protein
MRFALLLGAALLGAAAAFAWVVLAPAPGVERGPLVVEIPAQESAFGIARRLEEADVIRSRAAFVALTLGRGTVRQLKAGEYEVPQRASTLDVLHLLESGRVRQHVVLHPEGATVAELARVLEAGGLASAEEIEREARNPEFLRSLGIDGPSVEGYLFPDTYQLVRGLGAREILGRMVQRMQAKLTPEMRALAAERGLTVHELLTLASIVEREAVIEEERRLVAAVFWNRLRRNMLLQADPTVQYAVEKGRQALTRADLLTDHPYNTYRRPGLPPGPIASPGLATIEATLDPAPVKYLYFVALDDRRHHFSSTIEEHNAAVARYREWRRSGGRVASDRAS